MPCLLYACLYYSVIIVSTPYNNAGRQYVFIKLNVKLTSRGHISQAQITHYWTDCKIS